VSREDCLEAYGIAGGVPRWTLLHLARKGSVEGVKALLDSGIKEMDFDQARRLAGISNLIDTKRNEVVHRLLHLLPTSDYSECVLQFASTWVFKRLCEDSTGRILDEAEVFLRSDHAACYAALSGQIFEAFAHRKLAAGGSFLVRELTSGRESQEIIPPLPQQTITTLADLQPDAYGIPKARNFAVADAVVLPHRAYQMTVSASHPIKGAHLEQFVKAWERVELYFVVPEQRYNAFQEQTYVTNQGKAFQKAPKYFGEVKQYVLCMPLGCWPPQE